MSETRPPSRLRVRVEVVKHYHYPPLRLSYDDSAPAHRRLLSQPGVDRLRRVELIPARGSA